MSALLRIALVVLGVALVVSACGNKPGASNDAVEVSEDDNGHEVELLEGQVLEIVLPENPSTGYAWRVESFDDAVLEQLGDGTYTADETEGDVVGSGGTVQFRFKALRPGETDLTLGNFPPGEEEAEETFEVAAIVKEASDTEGAGEETGGH